MWISFIEAGTITGPDMSDFPKEVADAFKELYEMFDGDKLVREHQKRQGNSRNRPRNSQGDNNSNKQRRTNDRGNSSWNSKGSYEKKRWGEGSDSQNLSDASWNDSDGGIKRSKGMLGGVCVPKS